MTPNIHSILVPTDFSVASDRAVDYARALAGRLGASVHLVHVLDRLLTPEIAWAGPAAAAAAIHERRYQEGRLMLTVVAETLEEADVPTTSEVRSGTPAAEIIQAAVDYGADLIVMATHGRTGLSHLVLGSVAEHVIRHARCPVLAVRDNHLETCRVANPRLVERVA
jgi:nucleotide-binding universal stress UspA family protein